MATEPTEQQRQAMIDRIHQALADDQLAFSDIDERFEKVFAATTAAELEAAGAGLPELYQPPPPVAARHLGPQRTTSLLGDVKVGGWRKDRLVAPVEGGPTVRVNTFTLIGDAAVYSLSEVPEGALRRIWTALRNGGDKR